MSDSLQDAVNLAASADAPSSCGSVHTPGPWTQDKWGTVLDTNGEIVVVEGIALGGMSTAETKANARLIAAAPDLLTAASRAYQRLLALGDYAGRHTAQGQFELVLLREAIAAATGKHAMDVQLEAEAGANHG